MCFGSLASRKEATLYQRSNVLDFLSITLLEIIVAMLQFMKQNFPSFTRGTRFNRLFTFDGAVFYSMHCTSVGVFHLFFSLKVENSISMFNILSFLVTL